MSSTGRAFAAGTPKLCSSARPPARRRPDRLGCAGATIAAGRDTAHVKIFVPQTYVLGSTEAEARTRDAELLERQTV